MQAQKYILALAICLSFIQPSFGQELPERIRGTNPNYRQGDWISYGVTRYVNSVAVGQQYVYFGTTGGITRYDFFANEWDFPFTTSNGLPDNNITAVAYDVSTGYLWAATRTAICYYHPTAERWQNSFKDEIGIPRFDDVVSIGIGLNDVFFVTEGGRRFRGSKFGGAISAEISVGGSNGEVVWFGMRAYERPPYPQYFMGQGYYFQQEGVVNDFRLRRGEVTSAVNDKWGKVWMGTWRFGAIQGDVRSEMLDIMPYGLYSPRVDAIAADENGVWFGGRNTQVGESGLTYWDQRRNRWNYYESQFNAELLSDEINRLVVSGDTLFCATRFGVSIFDMRRNQWSRVTISHGLAHEFVWDVFADGKYLWIGTEAGMNLLDMTSLRSDSLKMTHIAPEALNLVPIYDVEVLEKEVWAGTRHGLFVYEIERNEGHYVAEEKGPIGESVYSISRNGDEMWFGGDGSVYGYNLRTGKWVDAPARNLNLPGPVLAIAANRQAVWAGTERGVYRFHRKNRDWRRFDTSDGLLDLEVNAILLDGDYIWLGTPAGATAFFWNDPGRVD